MSIKTSNQLSRLSSKFDGSHRITVFGWGLLGVQVYDDAETALRVIDLFADTDLPIAVKANILPKMLFVDPDAVLNTVEDFDAFLDALLWELCGLDITDSRKAERSQKVIDWNDDEAYLSASLFAAYGRTYEELKRELPFRELCQIIGLVPFETPMGQALYYRTAKPPKPTKNNQEERKAFHERQRFFALKKHETKERYASMNDAATSAFAALKGVSVDG